MELMTTITIGWEKGDKFAEANLPANHRLNNRLKKLHEQYPDEFQRFILNNDGTLYAKFPVKWLRLQRPSEVRHILTDEETRNGLERMKALRNTPNTQG